MFPVAAAAVVVATFIVLTTKKPTSQAATHPHSQGRFECCQLAFILFHIFYLHFFFTFHKFLITNI